MTLWTMMTRKTPIAQAQRMGELAMARMSVELLSAAAGNAVGRFMGNRSSKGARAARPDAGWPGVLDTRSVLNLKVGPAPRTPECLVGEPPTGGCSPEFPPAAVPGT